MAPFGGGAPDRPARGDGPGLAVFDFDDTLIHGDSLLPFLHRAVGKRRVRGSLAHAARQALLHHVRRRSRGDEHPTDLRTTVKTKLLERSLAGVSAEAAARAAEDLVGWVRWNERLRDTLLEHHAAGRHVLVATGALSLYMPRLLRDLPVDGLLATDVEVAGDVVTGRLPHGNCVRRLKAMRVKAYIETHGPFGPIWGYGNRPSDLPMLALTDHPTVV